MRLHERRCDLSLFQSIRDGDVLPRRAPRSGQPQWWNLLLALLYAFGETAYFGFHLLPQSGIELACDGIALALLMIASQANRSAVK